jgi:CHAT domain-containing protein
VSSKAHKSTITAKLQQPHRLFHFTGHGAHDYRHPKNSALALTGSDSLSAAEIAKLPLHTYDLITLAACETAVASQTDLDTDYVSLASAFLTAGATQVISTLWTVDSESNAWLMVKFYQHYLTRSPRPSSSPTLAPHPHPRSPRRLARIP